MKTHCKRGHEFTPDNCKWGTGYHGKPQRCCRICGNLAAKKKYRHDAEYRDRKKAAANAWRKTKYFVAGRSHSDAGGASAEHALLRANHEDDE